MLADDGVEVTILKVEFGSRPEAVDTEANLRVRIRIQCHRADPFEVRPPAEPTDLMDELPDLTCEVPYEHFVVRERAEAEFTTSPGGNEYKGRRLAHGWRGHIILFDEWVQVRELAFRVPTNAGPGSLSTKESTADFDRDLALVYKPGAELSPAASTFFKLESIPRKES